MRLTKHHGLGNDFLVLLDLEGTQPVTPELAVALCDRRTGVGADGLIRVTAGQGEADVAMLLLNADGSEAEMSGNGIRCLAQAVFQHRLSGLGHEGSHYALFRNRLANELASDLLCMFPLMAMTQRFRVTHLAHHQYLNDPERDPDNARLHFDGDRFPTL